MVVLAEPEARPGCSTVEDWSTLVSGGSTGPPSLHARMRGDLNGIFWSPLRLTETGKDDESADVVHHVIHLLKGAPV